MDAAHQFDGDMDVGVADDRFDVVSEDASGKRHVTRLVQVANDGAANLDGTTGSLENAFGVFGQNLRDAGPDVSQTNNRELKRLSRHKKSFRRIGPSVNAEACWRFTPCGPRIGAES